MQPDTDQRNCVVDGLEQKCGSVSSNAVLLWRPGLIMKDGQLYQRVHVAVKKRSVDVSVGGQASGGTDYYEWEIQLRVVKTSDWFDVGRIQRAWDRFVGATIPTVLANTPILCGGGAFGYAGASVGSTKG
jgi:hypothetical protein